MRPRRPALMPMRARPGQRGAISFLLLPADGDRCRLAVLELGDPFGYGCVVGWRQQQEAAVQLEGAGAVAEVEVVQDPEVQDRGRIDRIERDRLLVGVARLGELA